MAKKPEQEKKGRNGTGPEEKDREFSRVEGTGKKTMMKPFEQKDRNSHKTRAMPPFNQKLP